MFRKYKKLACLLGLVMMVMLGVDLAQASVSAEAVAADQDKRGRGRGDNGNGRGDRGDRGQRDSDRESRRQQRNSDNEPRRQQRNSDNESRRQQRNSDNESSRQQRWSDQQSRGQQRRSDGASPRQQNRSDWSSRRQQEWSDQQSRRQQRDSDRESRRQQRASDRNSNRRPQWTNWNWGAIQRNNVRQERRRDRDDDDRRFRRGGDGRRVVYVSPQRNYWNNISNGTRLFRGDDRRFDKEQRKFWKEQVKAQRRFERDQRRLNTRVYYGYNPFLENRNYGQTYYYGQPRTQYYAPYSGNVYYNDPLYNNDPVYYGSNNDDGYYGYDQGSSFKEQIIRTLISSVLGGLGGGGFDIGGLVQPRGYSNVVPYDYGGYDPSYGYYTPTYVSDRPYYGPAPSDYYYDQPYYSQGGLGGIGGSILGALPVADIVQQYTGDNPFVSQIVGSFLSQGYDQGFLAGQDARQYGYADAGYYNDPYSYQNGACDPYSASLGENRRYLSEGYELGYRDALNGNAMYDPQMQDPGGSDLVGVLLNNVLSGI